MSEKCTFIQPNNENDKRLYEFITDLRPGYVEIGDEKTVLPIKYVDIADKVENFNVKDNDIYVMSHPKAGTTWAQEMVWMIYNLDYEGGKASLKDRFPFLEFTCIHDFNSEKFKKRFPNFQHPSFFGDSVKIVDDMKASPRFIKTHLPWCLLPKEIRENKKQPKMIYVVRNPKDTCVSYFYHCKLLEGYEGNFEDFCKMFLSGRLNYGPFWNNVMDFWKRKDQPNILFITYEDMKKDLEPVIRQVADFLGKELTEDDVSKLKDHLSFESMKKNDSVNNIIGVKFIRSMHTNVVEGGSFLREGKVGNYKVHMNPETIKVFEEWIEENTKGTGLQFYA